MRLKVRESSQDGRRYIPPEDGVSAQVRTYATYLQIDFEMVRRHILRRWASYTEGDACGKAAAPVAYFLLSLMDGGVLVIYRRSDWAGLNWAGIWAGMSGRRHMSRPSSSWAGISLSLALSRPPLFTTYNM